MAQSLDYISEIFARPFKIKGMDISNQRTEKRSPFIVRTFLTSFMILFVKSFHLLCHRNSLFLLSFSLFTVSTCLFVKELFHQIILFPGFIRQNPALLFIFIMPGPSLPNRNRLRRSSTIQIDNFLHDEDDKQKFKAPKFQFQPLSSRYKQREEKKARDEEEKFRQLQIKLKKKKEREAAEAKAASENNDIVTDPEAEKAAKKAQLEKVSVDSFSFLDYNFLYQLNSKVGKKKARGDFSSQGGQGSRRGLGKLVRSMSITTQTQNLLNI